MKRIIICLFLLLSSSMSYAQAGKIRKLEELINKEEPGWSLVVEWAKDAKNKVEFLPKDEKRANAALLQAQVSTRSPMGAVIYESGGILVDDGWIRILGSGSERLNRSLMEWNYGKSYTANGEQPSFLLIADDVLGGFFAINAGAFGAEDIGNVFYFAPDNLEWESLDVGYSDFLIFCFSGDISTYYDGLRWQNWRAEIINLDGSKGIHCFPPLWTTEGKDIDKVSRKPVPMQELWGIYFNNLK